MTDRDMLELIATQVAKLTKDVDIIKNTMATKQELAEVRNTMATKQELAEVKQGLAGVKDEVASIKTIVVKIENEHGEKLGALLNGYKLNAARLDRVESRLDEHDEIFLKRLGWKS